MRTLLIALALALVSTTAHAQTCTVAQAAEDPRACSWISLQLSRANRFDDARRLTDQHDDAVVLRNSGIAITVIGSIATVIGASLFVKNLCFDSCSNASDTAGTAGTGLLVLGQVGIAAGIPLWVTGGVRAAKAERAMLTLSAGGARLVF